MHRDDFKKYSADFMRDQKTLLHHKGDAYAHGENQFQNFMENDDIGVGPEQTWAIFMRKHFNAILHYVHTGDSGGESIRSRCMDLANFCVIGAAMMEEFEENRKRVHSEPKEDFASGT